MSYGLNFPWLELGFLTWSTRTRRHERFKSISNNCIYIPNRFYLVPLSEIPARVYAFSSPLLSFLEFVVFCDKNPIWSKVANRNAVRRLLAFPEQYVKWQRRMENVYEGGRKWCVVAYSRRDAFSRYAPGRWSVRKIYRLPSRVLQIVTKYYRSCFFSPPSRGSLPRGA